MQKNTKYDLIIAGAGAAGLSLMWYLLQSDKLKEKNILLVDKFLKPNNDKTWCFWDDQYLPLDDIINHTWNQLEVIAYENRYHEKMDKYGYHCVKSGDYTARMLQIADQQKNITMLESGITGFSSSGDKGIIYTDKGDYEAEWIFQSALRPANYQELKSDISLKQHFLGIEIKTKKDLFDPDLVTLMDFDTDQNHGVTFFYVLPFSKNEALIEYTFFTENVLSDEEYMAGIKNHLAERYNLSDDDYEITREEKGVIPMEDRRYPGWYNDRVMNIGTVGGLTKPSTGYTFTRIHRHCAEIVSELEKGNRPPETGASSYRFRVYDMMLLYILKHEPKTSVKIFHDLFKKNSFERILTFLEEETTLPAEISIFSTLPYLPFFKSIWKMKHRILTGA